jgi:hypothetical protein
VLCRHRLKPLADLNQKLCELKYGTFDSSEGAWATISRHLQVVADNVPLSNMGFGAPNPNLKLHHRAAPLQ